MGNYFQVVFLLIFKALPKMAIRLLWPQSDKVRRWITFLLQDQWCWFGLQVKWLQHFSKCWFLETFKSNQGTHLVQWIFGADELLMAHWSSNIQQQMHLWKWRILTDLYTHLKAYPFFFRFCSTLQFLQKYYSTIEWTKASHEFVRTSLQII